MISPGTNCFLPNDDPPERDFILQQLDRVDWNFTGSRTLEQSVHSLHWFPGNFIPEIPSFLAQIISKPGDTILDPFCGSGTTGIEALRLGRHSLMSDVNRAGLQVAEGKLALLQGNDISDDLLRLAQELFWDSVLRIEDRGERGEGTNPELASWFDESTIAQLRFIWQLIVSLPDRRLSSVAHLLFSDTLFACAYTPGARTASGKRRRHHWGWIADNVRPLSLVRRNAIAMFRERLFKAKDVSALLGNKKLNVGMSVHRWDARSLPLQDSSVDAVICSPPYLNMIDYALANRLTYLWYGWPLADDKEQEIGARFARRRRSAVEDYLFQIKSAFGEICRCLKLGRYCAVVIGVSRPHGEELLKRFIDSVNLTGLRSIWGPSKRVPTRRRISDRKGTEPAEYLCVFERYQ